MEIFITQEQARVPVTILRPIGRINLGNADQLLEKAKELIDIGRRDLVIDLSNVPSITSAGLRVIVTIYKLLHNEALAPAVESIHDKAYEEKRPSLHLKLLIPNTEVRQIFNIAGFDLFIDIFEQKEEALGAF